MARLRARAFGSASKRLSQQLHASVSIREMTARIKVPRGRARMHASVACVLMALAATGPAGASAAATKSEKLLGVSIPASARIHGTTTSPATPPTTTQAQATTTQAKATTTPATTTPAGGAQPGTVAPTGSAPTTTAPASGAPTSTVPSTTTPTTIAPAGGSTTVVGVAHKASPSHTRLSTGALALAVLGALLILGCLTWAIGRWLALEPRWTISFMHSLREASYRASATWAEFGDWARLGH